MRTNRPYVQIDPDVLERVRQIDLLSYLREFEPSNLVKVKGTSNVYCTAEHDSLKISNGKWYWWSRGFGGYSALDYLIKVKEYDFVEAVEILTGQALADWKPPPPAEKKDEPKVLLLPPKFKNCDRVLQYLFGCGIDYKGEEQLLLRKEERQKNPVTATAGVYGIHFDPSVKPEGDKIRIHAVHEHATLVYLCLVAFTCLELNLALEIHVPGAEDALVNVCVERPDRNVQFRMIADDLVRRLSDVDQRRDNTVHLMELVLCHGNSGSDIHKSLMILAVSESGVIAVLVGDGAAVMELDTSVADIRSLIQPGAPFLLEPFACLVACRA